MRRVVIGVVLLAACGGGGAANPPDAGPPDAVPPDAHPDVSGFVASSITIPTDSTMASNLGFDLDDDGTIDNQLGDLFTAMIQAAGSQVSFQDALDTAVDEGAAILLVSLDACGNNPCFGTYAGTNPVPPACTDPNDPTTCRQHLQGSGVFDLDPAHPQSGEVPGTMDTTTFSGESGTVTLPLMFGGGAPVWVDLVVGHAELHDIATDIGDSKIGGAIPDLQVQDRVIPGWHAEVAAAIDRDCGHGTGTGDCDCVDSSEGSTWLGIFDENFDCAVLLSEFRANSLVMTLLRPDVDTNDDAIRDGLSMGVGITAVAGQFERP